MAKASSTGVGPTFSKQAASVPVASVLEVESAVPVKRVDTAVVPASVPKPTSALVLSSSKTAKRAKTLDVQKNTTKSQAPAAKKTADSAKSSAIVAKADAPGVGEDDEELQLRIALLDGLMQNLKKKESSTGVCKSMPEVVSTSDSKPSVRTAAPLLPRAGKSSNAEGSNIISTQSKMTVKVSGNNRDVKMGQQRTATSASSSPRIKSASQAKEKPTGAIDEKTAIVRLAPFAQPDKVAELKECEASLVSHRQTLSTQLYKLSAQMSQLEKHTSELKRADTYAAVLRRVS
jgi:hypothetical protein